MKEVDALALEGTIEFGPNSEWKSEPEQIEKKWLEKQPKVEAKWVQRRAEGHRRAS